jgi:hypothetical protein
MFKRSSRVLFVTLLLFVLAGATYAFAATNTVPPSIAGDGEGGISGFTVSGIEYSVSGFDITGVAFELSPAAPSGATVQAAIGTSTPVNQALVECSGSGTSWSCTFAAGYVTIKDSAALRVVVFQ